MLSIYKICRYLLNSALLLKTVTECTRRGRYAQRLIKIYYEWVLSYVKKQTPKFTPNIRHFLFRTSVTLCSGHLDIFHFEHPSLFVSVIRHVVFRTSCIFHSEHLNSFHFGHPEKRFYALYRISDIQSFVPMSGRAGTKRDAPSLSNLSYNYVICRN
jgi:hypothetical protein